MDTVVVTPAIDIQVVFSPDGGRAFQMRFAPLPLDVTSAALNETLDRVLDAVDRQRAKYELQDEEQKLLEQVERIKKYEGMDIRMLERHKQEWIAEERKGDWTPDRLPPSWRQQRENTQITLQKDRADAELREQRIKRLRQVVNGHAADSSSNSHARHANL